MPSVFYGTNAVDTVLSSADFQFLYGFGGDDALQSTSDGLYCELHGGDGNDFLDLSSPSFGLIDGGSGNDEIDGSGSFDEIYGGSGNDSISGQGVSDFVDGGSGNDGIFAAGVIFGGSGNDTIVVSPGLVGSRIDGGAGNDNCTGGEGDDRVFGGAGNDILNGGASRDVLVGGTGSDTLNGGDLARDVFRYTSVKDSLPGNKRDTIVFSAEDIIDLSRIDANTRRAGDQKFTFLGDDPFSGKAGEMRLTGNSSDSVLSGDVNGDRKPDFQIHVIDDAVALDNFVL